MRQRRRGAGFWLIVSCFVLMALSGLAMMLRPWEAQPVRRLERPLGTYEKLTGSIFMPPPADPTEVPLAFSIPLPAFPGAYAVWGATGRDARGHIWVGVSAKDVPTPSAHLFEFVPESGQVIDRGGVVAKLKECRVWRSGEGQMKIHSKIVQGQDGYLYFASMDEQGEIEDGSQLPTWGSHLWRIWPEDGHWEHLLAVPEGLIAVAGVGQYIYALGYFDHVLYQFDCATRKTASVQVGSVGGHISRNFLCDHRGHAYVPRLRATTGTKSIAVTLVEYDTSLQQIGESRLGNYIHTTPLDSHGIVGFQYLADRSIVFVTHLGYLYRLLIPEHGSALVAPEGWIHPKGRSYTASLFSYDGKRWVTGVSRREFDDGRNFEWVVYDLQNQSSQAFPLIVPIPKRGNPLLYGSLTRDDQGNFYAVGSDGAPTKSLPVFLQLRLPRH